MFMRFTITAVSSVFLFWHFGAAALPFPSSPDWKPLGDIVLYTPDNLWEHNNGAAEQYIEYGMQHCAVGEFRTGDISFSVEVYDMGNILNAFGIYQLKSRGIQSRIPIGAEASLTLPLQCMMVKDKYYVLFYVFDGLLREALAESLLTATAGALPGSSQLPEVLRLLPEKNQIPHSTGYCRISYEGLSDLNSCLFASYQDGSGETYQCFVIIPLDSVPAAQHFESLRGWQTQTKPDLLFKFRPISGMAVVGVTLNKGYLKGVTVKPDPGLLQKRLSSLCND